MLESTKTAPAYNSLKHLHLFSGSGSPENKCVFNKSGDAMVGALARPKAALSNGI